VKPNIRIARGQPTTVDIHVIHLPRGIKTPLSVILTTDDVNESKGRGEGFFKRTGYVAVYSVSDFVINDEGMRFRFGSPIRPR
jgi:hypothetical protein